MLGVEIRGVQKVSTDLTPYALAPLITSSSVSFSNLVMLSNTISF